MTVKINGIDGIALTKLDVLDELDEIKMCIAYKLNGKQYDYLPAGAEDQFKIEPIYETFPGWKSSTFGLTSWDNLPANAKKYINILEKLIEVDISVISTGPDRSETIDKSNLLDNI